MKYKVDCTLVTSKPAIDPKYAAVVKLDYVYDHHYCMLTVKASSPYAAAELASFALDEGFDQSTSICVDGRWTYEYDEDESGVLLDSTNW